MKYSIILITKDNNSILENNIKLLSNICKDITILNIGDKTLSYDNIKIYNNINKKDGINDILKNITDNVIIIDEQTLINKHFLISFYSNYNSECLNIFRVDNVNVQINTDKRIGKNTLNKTDIFDYNLSFNRNIIPYITDVNDLYEYCFNNSINIIYQNNIKVLSYNNLNKSNIFGKIRTLYDKPTKREMEIEMINKSTISNIIKNKNTEKYDIIIPFMYNGDRFPLFEASIKCLYEKTKTISNINIIVHETSSQQYITNDFIKKYNIKYIYSKWDEVFHRAWALNIPAKYYSNADIFVFFDADILITDEWLEELLYTDINKIYIGWGEMINLSEKATNQYIDNGDIINDYDRIRHPHPNAAAGGINIIPKKIFLNIHGWDESFKNTYGGEDNVLYYKLLNLGYNPNNFFKSCIYHLYHKHSTFKDPKRFVIFQKIKCYNKNMWLDHINSIKWGQKSEIMSFDGISNNINDKNIIKVLDRKLNILWCKMNTSNRVAGHLHHIIDELKQHSNVTLLKIDTKNEHPATLYRKYQNNIYKNDKVNYIIENQYKYDVIIIQHSLLFKGKWEDVKIPVFMLFEDQQGDINRDQLKMAIKYKWTVLHKYQLKHFNNDLNNQIYKHIWFPHSVNDKIFKDYHLDKDVFLLQTGAIYKVYETRNFIKNFFENGKFGNNWYRYIPRPKETDSVKWPIGVDYAKEINKSYMTVCCGSKLEYSVMKYFEIPLCGSIVFGDYFDELRDLGFKPNINMIEIDKDNFEEQLHSIRGNKNFLNDVMINGMNLIKDNYTNKICAIKLIKLINEEI